MKSTDVIGQYVLQKLNAKYGTEEVNIGTDAKLDKGLMHFTVKRYNVKGIGNLCLLNMKGMFGLMRMETVVLSCDTKDVPLFNADSVSAMGNVTQIVELYDTRIAKKDDRLEETCQAIKEQDRDIPDYSSGAHWYDSMLYPCSYAKKTKGDNSRIATSCMKYVDAFLEELDRADVCDPEEKRNHNRVLPQGLLDNGGPAIDQVRKMFGEEVTQRLVLGHMYGLD